MTAYQYTKLKDRRVNVLQNIKSGSNVVKWQTELKCIDSTLEEAENDPEIQNYKDLIKRKSRLQQTLGSWKYHHKDTTKLEAQIEEITTTISLLMEGSQNQPTEPLIIVTPEDRATPIPLQSETTPPDIVNIIKDLFEKHLPPQPTQKASQPTYYIINLAWSKADSDDKVINMIRDFLNTSNWIDRESNLSEDRGESMLVWKFNYDTIEEQAMVKAIKTCASHMIDTLKKWSLTTDAEIFGRVQKF